MGQHVRALAHHGDHIVAKIEGVRRAVEVLNGALMSQIVRRSAAIVEPAGFGLLRAIDDYPGSPEVRAGLQLLALTFVRPGELRGATWAQIDFGAAI